MSTALPILENFDQAKEVFGTRMHNTFQGHFGKEPKAGGKEHERSMDMLIDA
jgi:hypothetical protein